MKKIIVSLLIGLFLGAGVPALARALPGCCQPGAACCTPGSDCCSK